MFGNDRTREPWLSDAALVKQAELRRKFSTGEPITVDDMAGSLEPRVAPAPLECCVNCGLDARGEVGGEYHAGWRWCALCIGRSRHEQR